MSPWIALAAVLAGCTDYEFAKEGAEAGRGRRDSGGPESDTDAPDTGHGDSGSVDTAPGDPDAPDTGPDDACWEPEDGYAQNDAARIVVTDASVTITTTLVASDTDYDDDLYLDIPDSTLLAHAWLDPAGTMVTFGPYAAETELVFGIGILDTGDHWQSGPASRNADGVVHVAVTYEGGCSWLIGFEDLYGGGDLDFNDVVLRVQGMLREDQ